MQPIEIGDVVRLKSGNPQMVVERVIEDDTPGAWRRLECVFFNQQLAQFQHVTVQETSLVKVVAP